MQRKSAAGRRKHARRALRGGRFTYACPPAVAPRAGESQPYLFSAAGGRSAALPFFRRGREKRSPKDPAKTARKEGVEKRRRKIERKTRKKKIKKVTKIT